jgi:two-component system sensor histidine kinase TctE
LAVLKTQVQSARRGDVAPAQALQEIAHTVDGATALANQMLALAKVEQLRHQGEAPLTDWSATVRAVALDVSALIADAGVDFELQTETVHVRAHEWALRELTRNLLHNAIRHSPRSGRLAVTVKAAGDEALLCIADSGPGIADAQRERLFQPFAASQPDTAGHEGSGLGLAICREIVTALGGRITLDNRLQDGHTVGLDACVTLPRTHEHRHP